MFSDKSFDYTQTCQFLVVPTKMQGFLEKSCGNNQRAGLDARAGGPGGAAPDAGLPPALRPAAPSHSPSLAPTKHRLRRHIY